MASGLPTHPLALSRAALHVFGLWGFWVAQPLYDLVSRNPAFLVAHGAELSTELFFALSLSVVGPGILVLPIGIAARMGRIAGWCVYGAVVGALFAVMALILLHRVDPLGPVFLAAVALAVGTLGALASLRSQGWARVLSALSLAGLVFPLLFLARSPLWEGSGVDGLPEVETIGSSTPVVLLVLDEFPLASLLDSAGNIDRARYPNLADFAAESLWFQEATAVASDTSIAVPAILTGRYPHEPLPPTWRQQPENLFTLLRRGGRLEVFEEITRLCPKAVCSGARHHGSPSARLSSLLLDSAVVYLHLVVPRHWSERLPPIDGSWAGFVAGARFGGLAESAEVGGHRGRWSGFGGLLAAIREEPEARLYFLHLLAPHAPWDTLPSGKEYGPVDMFPHGFSADAVGPDVWASVQGLQRHLLQVVYVDRILGELFDTLRKVGLYDRALVIVSSDHGASFEPGTNRRYLAGGNASDLLSVPLFVKLPGQTAGERRGQLAETVDILPTIAAVLGVELPWEVDGHSLLDAAAPQRTFKQAYRGGPLRFEPEAIAAARVRTVARIDSLFGPGVSGLYEVGPYRQLLGQPSAPRVEPGGEEEPLVALHRPERFERVDLAARSIPVHVQGTLQGGGPAEGPLQLAVGVNGRIAAVTRTHGHETGAPAFSALLPEQVFGPGANEVAIYRVQETDAGIGLIPLHRNDRRFELVERGGEEWILDGRREIPVLEGVIRGTAVFAGGGMTGVAAQRAKRRPADEILLFVGGEMVFRGTPGGLPDLIDEVEGASFRFSLPSDWADGSPAGRVGVRMFAVTDGTAGELAIQYPKPRERARR